MNISANFRKFWGRHHILGQVARHSHPQNTIHQSHNSASIHLAVQHISGSLCNFYYSVALVRERTIPTERPPPVGEVSANFCG